MKTKNKFILLCTLTFFVAVALVGFRVFFLPQSKLSKAANIQVDQALGWRFPIAKFPLTGSGSGLLAYSDIRDPGGIPQGLPVRLKIPAIGVDSAIEDALITADGRMDVPLGSKNVAWFALGPHPGQVGSSVIGGHFGMSNGVPFVFYDLDKLNVGDKIYIVDDKDDTLSFVVRSIKLFDRDADATTVFTSEDGLAHLNLITCEGVWNKINDSYPKRRVVFTDALPVDGAIAPASSAFHRVLNIGSKGGDVELLQTMLLSKGFLTLPPGVLKGYFGRLTSIALAKYQTSVGLPAVGVFGPMTRAKLIAELQHNPSIPNTGDDGDLVMTAGVEKPVIPINTDNSPVIHQPFMQLIKDLYGTPMDGLITSLLLIMILFTAFKIIRLLKRSSNLKRRLQI